MSWFRGPAGGYAHADGPAQQVAFAGQGWTPVGDDEAVQAVTRGLELTVGGDTSGTFDADAVAAATEEEAHAARSAAARKAAETRAANRAAAETAAATETAAGAPPVAPAAPDDGTA